VSGSLAVNDTVIGNTLLDGTRVKTFGTGVGGVGTYILNQAPPADITVAQSMISITPAFDDVHVGIAHAPVLDAANVYVIKVSG
jgi:hypothetical protein